MRNGDAHSAVRVLPADGAHPAAPRPPDPGEGRQRRWFFPLVIVGFALLAFVGATRPSPQPEAEAALTTLPPGLSEVSTELIDLTNSTDTDAMTTDWVAADFKWPGRINAIVAHGNSLVAFGYDDEGAMAWMSGAGSSWRKVPRFEDPGNHESSVDHAVVWKGEIIALGSVGNEVGLWAAQSRTNWVYQGTIPEMGNELLLGLAATDRLLAISRKDGTHRSWVSEDGFNWTELEDVSALDDVQVHSVRGIGDWFYATGQGRNASIGDAAIYRSRDGVTWEETGLSEGNLPAQSATVLDVAATSDGLLAVGVLNNDIAVWVSADGDRWVRIAQDDTALLGSEVILELLSIGNGGEALLSIDDQEHRLTTGSQVLTNEGLLTVVAVRTDSVTVEWSGGSPIDLDADTGPFAVRLQRSPMSVSAEGPRIVIAGWVGVESPRTPAVWTSTDGGRTWSFTNPDPTVQGWARAVAITGASIALGGGFDSETPQLWHSTWDTNQMEAAGMELIEAYFDAIDRRDSNAVAALLPDGPAQFQIPSLAGVDLPWWDESSGDVDPDAVADTVNYMAALSTRIELGECRTRMLLGEVDSLRVSCDFTVESDLLSTYSNEGYAGTAEIVVEHGGITRFRLATVLSAPMWQMLATGYRSTDPTTQALLDNPETRPIDPVFTVESAPVHLRAAEEFIATLLRPGDTRIVETTLGTMEWSWLDPAPLPVYYFNWVTHYDGGFVAIGQGDTERWTEEMTLWTSQDGFAWEMMDGPPNVTGMWNLQPFRSGLIGQAWERERSFLAFYDGNEWAEIDLPGSEDAGPSYDVRYLATSGETALVVTVEWSEDYESAPESHQAWLIGPDDEPRETKLPTRFSGQDPSIGLAGSDEGFVLATAEFGSPRSMHVWFSRDGYDWDEVAATTSIEDAVYVWHLQRHNNLYFVVGEGAESGCVTTGEGGGFCEQLVGLWSSPDGADWERVFTTSGDPVGAYELGSGPLGLVAMAVDFYADGPLPRPLYLSPDGSTWERAGNLAFMHPDAEWWWASLPAVGTDRILIPGSAYQPSAGVDEDTPFLIVGRLLDP